MGKVIHWELFKKFKFDHRNKCHMHNSEFDLKKSNAEVSLDFEIQTDQLISAQRLDQRQKKKTCRIADFTVSADPRVKNKRKQKKR